MFLKAFPSGPLDTNAYIVACPQTRQAAIVDPAPDSYERLIAFIQEGNLAPVAILLTHSHWDHIADVKAIKIKYSIPVSIHPLDAPNLKNPGADGLPCWLDIPGVVADRLIKEGDVIAIGNLTFKVIETPGHTPGGVCFYCSDEGILLSGDTLFKGTIGNVSFPTSRPDLMWESLRKLSLLPKGTRVYPGHGSSTTIGDENWLSRAEEVFG